jgi:hypothetical protein
VGRSQRVVPPSTRRALNVRDKGCRRPGCDRPAPWTAAYHIVHWSHHGETNLANLVYRKDVPSLAGSRACRESPWA